MTADGAAAPIVTPAPISPPSRTSSKRDSKARKPPLMGPTRTLTSHGPGPRVAAAAAAAAAARSPLPAPAPRLLRKPASRLRLHSPDPGSLIDRMRQHPTVSLFVRPISWTNLHMELLKVRFVESAVARPSPGPAPPVFLLDGRVGYRADLAPVDEALGALASGAGADAYWSPGPVRAILRSSFGPVFRNELEHPEMSLVFDSKKYHDTARIPVMWESAAAGAASPWPPASFGSSLTDPAESFMVPPSGASSPAATTIGTGPARAGAPVLGYIGRQQIAAMRGRQFRIIHGPGDNANEPVRRLSRLRAKMSQPADPDRDPFIVGVLISMVQRHYHAAVRSRPSSQSAAASSSSSAWSGSGAGVTSGSAASSFGTTPSQGRSGASSGFSDLTVRVLVDDRAGERFIVYTAVVTLEFIRQFRYPFRAAKADPDRAGMTIRYTQVPFGPAAVVTRHLGLALGADLVGELAEEEGGAAAADMRGRERDPSRKRKRRLERAEVSEVLLHRSLVREVSPVGEAPVSPKRRHCADSGHDGMDDIQQQQQRGFVEDGGGGVWI